MNVESVNLALGGLRLYGAMNTDKRLLDKPDVIRSKFCLYLFQQIMVQVLYVRRNTGFRPDELVCAVLNVNRKPIS